MPKYKVDLERKMFQVAGVEVEADDPEAAYEEACKVADAKDLWESTQPDDGPYFELGCEEIGNG